jgi:hypothetical protein
MPECLAKLGLSLPAPLHAHHDFYSLRDTVITGWAGAMMKDGFLLAPDPAPNWTAHLRARRHRLRLLSSTSPYFNLMTPIPARGHIFHWLFESIVPLLTFLESGGRESGVGLIVNAERSAIQEATIAYFQARYGINCLEPLGAGDAALVPNLKTAIRTPHGPLGLQSPIGMETIEDLGRFIARDVPESGFPKRIYISRNDARLRRVANEARIFPVLEERGFQRLILKGLPMALQVQHFRQAEAVVAPHGAGLAHTVWCKPGTKVIEFFPGLGGPRGNAKNSTANMWLIATQRALDYSCYLAGPPQTRSDAFAIPEDLVLHALEAASIK